MTIDQEEIEAIAIVTAEYLQKPEMRDNPTALKEFWDILLEPLAKDPALEPTARAFGDYFAELADQELISSFEEALSRALQGGMAKGT